MQDFEAQFDELANITPAQHDIAIKQLLQPSVPKREDFERVADAGDASAGMEIVEI